MIGKNLSSTKGKPCSCPSGKLCTACKAKKVLKPHVTIEEPSRLPVPIIVSYSKQKQTTIQDVAKRSRKRWRSRKQQYDPTPNKLTSLCRWYKRRKALKQLTALNKEEEERRRREDYQNELIKGWAKLEKARQLEKVVASYEPKLPSLPPPKHEISLKERLTIAPRPKPQKQPEYFIEEKTTKTNPWTKTVKKKDVAVKERAANVKPRAENRYVSVKKYAPKDSITHRFVNCCYRICCQFYCCLTCILIIAFVVIFIL